MKNITLSAEEKDIEAARERARAEQTTLNEQFRAWLADYARSRNRVRDYEAVVARLKGKVHVGRKLSRDAMNER